MKLNLSRLQARQGQTNLQMCISLEPLGSCFDFQGALSRGVAQNASACDWIDLKPIRGTKHWTHQCQPPHRGVLCTIILLSSYYTYKNMSQQMVARLLDYWKLFRYSPADRTKKVIHTYIQYIHTSTYIQVHTQD